MSKLDRIMVGVCVFAIVMGIGGAIIAALNDTISRSAAIIYPTCSSIWALIVLIRILSPRKEEER